MLAYQPKLSLPELRVVGAEALMRWNRPEAGNVPPEVFIDLAEMTGGVPGVESNVPPGTEQKPAQTSSTTSFG